MLTVLQERFCLEYAKSGNATDAYKKAGYKPKNENAAAASATRLLRNVKVQDRLHELQQATATPAIADAQEIQSLLTDAMRNASVNGDVLGLCKTADILNKMHGSYVNKTEITGGGGGPLRFIWEDEDSDAAGECEAGKDSI